MQKHRSKKLYIAKGIESLYNPSQATVEKGDLEKRRKAHGWEREEKPMGGWFGYGNT